jgi:hypothetical protein
MIGISMGAVDTFSLRILATGFTISLPFVAAYQQLAAFRTKEMDRKRSMYIQEIANYTYMRHLVTEEDITCL